MLFCLVPLTSAHAADKPAAYDPDRCENVGLGIGFFVKKGEVVPCTGDLAPTPELTRLLKIETDYETQTKELESLKKSAASDAVLAQQRLDKAEGNLRECEEEKTPAPVVQHWYQTTAFTVVVTAVLATAAGTALGVAISR